MPITETFLYDTVTVILVFNGGLIFMLLGFLTEWPKKILFHLIAMTLFLPLAIMHIAMGGRFDESISLAFFGLGIINMLIFLYEGGSALMRYSQRWRY